MDYVEAETRAWCHRHLRVEEPELSLRTPQLRPRIVDDVDEQGIITQDPKAWADAVADVAAKRRALLVSPPQRVGQGRLLAYRPRDNLFDGAAQAASFHFFDTNNVPPWDTWVRFEHQILQSWIPAEAEHLAQPAVDVNPEMCIWWVDEGNPEERSPGD